MKTTLSFIVLSLFLSLNGYCQEITLGKFLGSINASKFVGNAKYKLYEKQVEMVELNAAAQSRSTTISFKFSPCAASGDFMAHTQSGKIISKGEITILAKPSATAGINTIKYKVYFEDASVVSCSDAKACDNTMATTVLLKPQRVCWIYYNYDGNGKFINSTSNGFDLKSGQPWTLIPPNF